MSMFYSGRTGFAAVLTGDEWVDVWNRNHADDDQVDDPCDAYEVDYAGSEWDEGNCCGFEVCTSSDTDVFDGSLGSFGQSIDADPDAYDGSNGTVIVFFAPKGPGYFSVAYRNIDEMVADIIAQSETFVPGDEEFVRSHLADVSIVCNC